MINVARVLQTRRQERKADLFHVAHKSVRKETENSFRDWSAITSTKVYSNSLAINLMAFESVMEGMYDVTVDIKYNWKYNDDIYR